jgi:hypothetical protein
MDNLRELATDPRYEIVRIKAVLIPFSVRFDFPDELRETTPRAVLKSIEGVRVLRFYTPPCSPDIIEFRGYLFKVSGRFHEDVKVKGSPQKDRMPIVITEYIGPTE